MNRIILNNENIKFNLDETIKHQYNEDIINLLQITIFKSTNLEIYIDNDLEKKYQIQITVLENSNVNVLEIKKNNKIKALITYNIGENSIVNIKKINNIMEINERNIIDLKGYNSSVEVILKTVCENVEKYDLVIKHSSSYSNSKIIMDGINISGDLQFNPTTYVENKIKKCNVIQEAKIINIYNNKCSIKPGLLIDEKDTNTKQIIFLGGSKDKDIKKQIKDFIKNDISLKLANHFKKYWG